MKLFSYFKNTGDWGGCEKEYILAQSQEAAEKHPRFLRDYELYKRAKWDIDKRPTEVTGDEILNTLKVFSEEREDYTLEYRIKLK